MSAPRPTEEAAPAAPSFEWVTRPRNFDKEREETNQFVEVVGDHPLVDKPLVVSTSSSSLALSGSSASLLRSSSSFVNAPGAGQGPTDIPVVISAAPGVVDPLSAALASDPLSAVVVDPLSAALADPLSAAAATSAPNKAAPSSIPITRAVSMSTLVKERKDEKLRPVAEDITPLSWASKKAAVLQKYTTTEAISIPSFVSGVSKVNMPVDKVKARLEQLEQFEEDDGDETLTLTSKDYIKHIEKLQVELTEAWDSEQRVKALKIAIKLAKLLGDTTEVPGFYPSKWVLITEIMDAFGDLVFRRLKERSTIFDGDTPIPLKDNFRTEDVADHAKETTKNWFFKIASIRELLPRIYVEMAIIRSYCFIYNDYFPTAIKNLSRIIRGIGDPLVSMYARAYLARRAHEIAPRLKDQLVLAIDDYIFLQKTFLDQKSAAERERKNLTLPQYLDLFTPGLDWLMQCLAWQANEELFRQTLEKFKTDKNGAVLNAIISAFEPKFISGNATMFIDQIKSVDPTTFPIYELYKTLGLNLVLQPPTAMTPKEAAQLFTSIWADVTNMMEVDKYISVAEIYVEFPVKHINARATQYLLDDIVKHVSPDRKFLDLQGQLQSIASKLLLNSKNFTELFTLEAFLPFLDLFRGNTQIEVNKALLTAFSKGNDTISDPVIINTLFSVAKTVHDSINALSFVDEVRRINKLIVSFIHKVEFGTDVEKQLNFYVECRRAFANLDLVKNTMVKGVCTLAMKTLTMAKGKHTKETSAFVRACISYAYITIPSMEDPIARLYLYLLSGQVALLNQSIPQAESLFKSAVALIQEVPTQLENKKDTKMHSSEPELSEFIHNFIATLVAVPGHPELGPFYLLRGLQKVIQDYPWPEGTGVKAESYVSMISMLAASAQTSLPYHYAKVEANDILYGGTIEYEQEIDEFINELIKLILDEVAVLKRKQKEFGMKTKKAKVCLDLMNRILTLSKLTPKLYNLCVELHDLSKKNKTHSFYRKQTTTYLKRLRDSPENKSNALYGKLYEKMIAPII